MADLKPITKVFNKHAGRAKERILRNFGKADKTADEDFDLNVKNFYKQHAAVTRLNKELKNYYLSLKMMQTARKQLLDTINELYEPCWDGLSQFMCNSEILCRNHEEYLVKINEEVITPANIHISLYPDISNKIGKRNRKLLDYDNCRHNLQNVENVKKREEPKILKAKEQLEEARNNFEVINSELHMYLPSMYESRVHFFSSSLCSLILLEANFHRDDANILYDMLHVLSKLDTAYLQTPSVTSEESTTCVKSEIFLSASEKDKDDASSSEGCSYHTPPTTAERNADGSQYWQGRSAEFRQILNTRLKMDPVSEIVEVEKDKIDKLAVDETKPINIEVSEECIVIGENQKQSIEFAQDISMTAPKNAKLPIETADAKTSDFAVEKTGSAKQVIDVIQEPSNYHVLYQVKGSFKYIAEDNDELTFDVGDIIDVIAYDDPNEQEEGWLMGVFEQKKGLFPANFTVRL